jgi:hypothetical protein
MTPEASPQDATAPATPEPALPAPMIHEAELESGPSGGILRGAEITFDQAVARRRTGGDVVVCGDDTDTNRRAAEQIESAVGPCVRGEPHSKAGPRALPHYQPDPRPPAGHTFYETARRKARKKK